MTIKQFLESKSHRQLAAEIKRWKQSLAILESKNPGEPSTRKDLLRSQIALYETFLRAHRYKVD